MPPPGQYALDNNRPPDENPNGAPVSDTDSQESTRDVDPQEPSSSRDIVERNMVLELYQSLTRTGGTRRPADVLLSECLLYDEDRDEVVTEVMRLLTKVCTDAVLGQANKAGIRKLCIALKDDFACGAMRIRKPDDFPVDAFSEEAFESKEVLECFLDTGLSLTSGWQVDPAHRTGVYTMQYLDVWYWTVRAGADDVMRKLENEDVKPGNGVAVDQDLASYTSMSVDHLRKILCIHDNDLTWKWDEHAFTRASSAISQLLLIYGERNGAGSVQQITSGTGLLHWLVHCQRHELREEARDYASYLLDGLLNGDDRSTPMVDVNECFDLRQASHQPLNDHELGVVNIETPLHGAVFFGWEDMIKLLLQHDADVQKRGDRSGLTPYGLATKLDGLENVCIFIKDDKTRTDLDRGDTEGHFDWWNGDQASLGWAGGNRQRRELLTRLQTRVADGSGSRQEDPNAEVGAEGDAS